MAIATISSAPTGWNTLATNLAPYDEGAAGQTRLIATAINPADLTVTPVTFSQFVPTGATGVGTPAAANPSGTVYAANFPNEVIQFIQLAQLGWGAQLGAGRRISDWAAAVLLMEMLRAYLLPGVPRNVGGQIVG